MESDDFTEHCIIDELVLPPGLLLATKTLVLPCLEDVEYPHFLSDILLISYQTSSSFPVKHRNKQLRYVLHQSYR